MASEAELRLRERLSRLKSITLLGGAKLSGELERLQKQLDRMTAEPTEDEIWRSVELARHQDRPYTLDYVERLLEDWVELHGDRGRADDAALVCGLGSFDGRTVALVGQQKGRDVKERTKRNFGMAYPEGYRKAMRVMKLADRFGYPADHPCRHAGRLSGRRRRAARAGRRDRSLAGDDAPPRRPDRERRDRRRGLGRRDRDRGRRPRADAGERDLLGHLARGLRRDPLA